MNFIARSSSLVLAGENRSVKVPQLDPEGKPLLDATGAEMPPKEYLQAVRTIVRVAALKALKGKLLYIKDVECPLVDFSKPVQLEVIEVVGSLPFEHPDNDGVTLTRDMFVTEGVTND